VVGTEQLHRDKGQNSIGNVKPKLRESIVQIGRAMKSDLHQNESEKHKHGREQRIPSELTSPAASSDAIQINKTTAAPASNSAMDQSCTMPSARGPNIRRVQSATNSEIRNPRSSR
jgi:hypothetical protein